LAALFDETGVVGRNILLKPESKIRMTVVLCYPRKRLKYVTTEYTSSE
jgi:hypothetical protein